MHRVRVRVCVVVQVLEILAHVNKRVRAQPSHTLPLLELSAMYRDASAAAMVRPASGMRCSQPWASHAS